MKRALIGLFFVGACSDSSGGINGPDASVEAVRQIARGDGAACTNSATVLTLSDIVFPLSQPLPHWTASQHDDFRATVRAGVEQVTTKSIDRETKRMVCSGEFYASWGADVWSAPIEYELATEVGDQAIIITVEDAIGARNAYYNALNDYYNARIEPGRAAARELQEVADRYAEGANICEKLSSPPHSLLEIQRAQSWLETVSQDTSADGEATRACVAKIADSPVTADNIASQSDADIPIGPAPAQ